MTSLIRSSTLVAAFAENSAIQHRHFQSVRCARITARTTSTSTIVGSETGSANTAENGSTPTGTVRTEKAADETTVGDEILRGRNVTKTNPTDANRQAPGVTFSIR